MYAEGDTVSVIILHVTRWHCDSVHKLLSSVTGGEHIYLSAVSAQHLVWVEADPDMQA